MDLETVIRMALASPPGSVIHATRDSAGDQPEVYEIQTINGQKPAEA